MAENQEQDEDEENAPEPLEGEEALAKARDGKDAWNKWAEENPGRVLLAMQEKPFSVKKPLARGSMCLRCSKAALVSRSCS